MKTFLKHAKTEMNFLALFYLLIGLIFCLFDVKIVTTFIRCIGIVFVLYGLWEMYRYFIKRANLSTIPLLIGIPCLLLGILFLSKPNLLIQTVSIYTGILLIFNAIIHIQASLVEKDLGFMKWKYSFVYSILLLILGLALLFSPLSTVSKIIKLCGTFLCLIGLGLFISSYRIQKLYKKEQNFIEGDYRDL